MNRNRVSFTSPEVHSPGRSRDAFKMIVAERDDKVRQLQRDLERQRKKSQDFEHEVEMQDQVLAQKETELEEVTRQMFKNKQTIRRLHSEVDACREIQNDQDSGLQQNKNYELRSLQRDNRVLEQENKELTKQMEELHSLIDSQNLKLKRLERAELVIKQQHGKLEELTMKLEELTQKNEVLGESLQASLVENEALMESHRQLSEERRNTLNQSDSFSGVGESMGGVIELQLQESQEQLQSMQLQLVDLQKQLIRCSEETISYRSEKEVMIDELKENVQSLKAEIKTKDVATKKLERKMEGKVDQVNVIKQELEEMREAFEDLCVSSEDKQKNLEEQIEKEEEQANILKENLCKLEAEFDHASGLIRQLTVTEDELKLELRHSLAENESLTMEVVELNAKLKGLKDELESVASDCESKEMELEENFQKVGDWESQLLEATRKNEANLQRVQEQLMLIDQLQVHLKAEGTRSDEMSNELAQSAARVDTLSVELKCETEKCESLQLQLSELHETRKDEINCKVMEIEVLQSELEWAEQKSEELLISLDSFVCDKEIVEKKFQSAAAELQLCLDEKKSLQAQLAVAMQEKDICELKTNTISCDMDQLTKKLQEEINSKERQSAELQEVKENCRILSEKLEKDRAEERRDCLAMQMNEALWMESNLKDIKLQYESLLQEANKKSEHCEKELKEKNAQLEQLSHAFHEKEADSVELVNELELISVELHLRELELQEANSRIMKLQAVESGKQSDESVVAENSAIEEVQRLACELESKELDLQCLRGEFTRFRAQLNADLATKQSIIDQLNEKMLLQAGDSMTRFLGVSPISLGENSAGKSSRRLGRSSPDGRVVRSSPRGPCSVSQSPQSPLNFSHIYQTNAALVSSSSMEKPLHTGSFGDPASRPSAARCIAAEGEFAAEQIPLAEADALRSKVVELEEHNFQLLAELTDKTDRARPAGKRESGCQTDRPDSTEAATQANRGSRRTMEWKLQVMEMKMSQALFDLRLALRAEQKNAKNLKKELQQAELRAAAREEELLCELHAFQASMKNDQDEFERRAQCLNHDSFLLSARNSTSDGGKLREDLPQILINSSPVNSGQRAVKLSRSSRSLSDHGRGDRRSLTPDGFGRREKPLRRSLSSHRTGAQPRAGDESASAPLRVPFCDLKNQINRPRSDDRVSWTSQSAKGVNPPAKGMSPSAKGMSLQAKRTSWSASKSEGFPNICDDEGRLTSADHSFKRRIHIDRVARSPSIHSCSLTSSANIPTPAVFKSPSLNSLHCVSALPSCSRRSQVSRLSVSSSAGVEDVSMKFPSGLLQCEDEPVSMAELCFGTLSSVQEGDVPKDAPLDTTNETCEVAGVLNGAALGGEFESRLSSIAGSESDMQTLERRIDVGARVRELESRLKCMLQPPQTIKKIRSKSMSHSLSEVARRYINSGSCESLLKMEMLTSQGRSASENCVSSPPAGRIAKPGGATLISAHDSAMKISRNYRNRDANKENQEALKLSTPVKPPQGPSKLKKLSMGISRQKARMYRVNTSDGADGGNKKSRRKRRPLAGLRHVCNIPRSPQKLSCLVGSPPELAKITGSLPDKGQRASLGT